jgi:hypothetical protein
MTLHRPLPFACVTDAMDDIAAPFATTQGSVVAPGSHEPDPDWQPL